MEAAQLELILGDRVSTEEIVQALVGLIKNSPELRRAILDVVWACPNVAVRV